MKTNYRIIFKPPGKCELYVNTLGQIVTSTAANGEMLFATESEAQAALAQLQQMHGDSIKDWAPTIKLSGEAGEDKVEPGEYYGGDLGSTLYKVTICDECGLPATKIIQEVYFGLSDKGKAKSDKWQADKKRLPYDIELCDCAHNQEDEEDEET